MVNFLRYAFRETAVNLWRNRLMTMAAILTVAVSLSLVGAALFMKQGAAQASIAWEKGTQVTVWMHPTATNDEIGGIKLKLNQDPYVANCVFWSRTRDYQEALKILTGGEVQTLTPATMPSSVRCTPVQTADVPIVISQFQGQPGVLQVTAPEQQIHAIQTTVEIMQLIFILVALVLLLSASVLILNTIRMAIFARRREVSVMKLVGATNWFIRIPFIAEGLIQGVIGGVLASGVVYGIHVAVDHLSNAADPTSLLTEMRLTGWQVFATDVVVILLGAIIGSLGSAFAVRRFLDV
jgi:cell division transport system permease protein